jgi:hypothetical protein
MERKIFKAYYVWPRFPSISMSGNVCMLSCKHCNKVYLNDMQSLTKPEQLLKLCKKLDNNGGVGLLLSGGCNKQGEMLNLRRFLPTIKKIKEETNLIVKLHTGLVDEELAKSIADAGVDIASMECIGSNETIKEVFGLNAAIETYANTFRNLQDAEVKHIVPHICIGLHKGKIIGEYKALQIIKETCNPSVIVFIVLRPTPGTKYKNIHPPKPDEIKKIISKAKKIFPNVELSLGCMRPRNNYRKDLEIAALEAGVTRMEIPLEATIIKAKSIGYKIKRIDACCALPEELEHRAIKPP